MLQNATPLRKSAPWPPNMSYGDVFRPVPATPNPSSQILFKHPTPVIVFETATSPHDGLAHFSPGAEPTAAAVKKWWGHAGTIRFTARFNTFEFEMWPRALFQPSNFQKWCKHLLLSPFWLRNMLRATAACTFSTTQRPKLLRQWGVFSILTSKSASRHSGVQFWSLLRPDGSAPAGLASLLFDLPEPHNIGKSQCFVTFLPFRAPGSSFFWLFLFWLLLFWVFLFSDSFFSLTLLTIVAASVYNAEIWLLNFLREYIHISFMYILYIYIYVYIKII